MGTNTREGCTEESGSARNKLRLVRRASLRFIDGQRGGGVFYRGLQGKMYLQFFRCRIPIGFIYRLLQCSLCLGV